MSGGPSRKRPEGHPNHWPIEDYNALVRLIELAEARDEEHPVDRVQLAAKEDMGIHPKHWLVKNVLTFVYGCFPLYGGIQYAETPEAFFRFSDREDRRDRATLEWAMELRDANNRGVR